MKIGIACVYYVPDESLWVLHEQLTQIEQSLPRHDITVYGADVRLSDRVKGVLSAKPYVKLFSLTDISPYPNREHGESLTELVERAFKDGCDFVLTLDVDSWPIDPDWPNRITALLADTDGLVAVERQENDDSFLPHPLGTVITRDFWQAYAFDFYPSQMVIDSPDFQAFMKATGQREDTGIGLAECLWRHQCRWHRLTRSNKVNLHYLMAGIYGDMIFHLGASSRAPEFYKDVCSGPIAKLTMLFEKKPILWRLREAYKRLKIKQAGRKLQTIIHALKEGTLYQRLRGTHH